MPSIEIEQDSWEHKLLESIITHKDELADVLMWDEDTFRATVKALERDIHRCTSQKPMLGRSR